MNTSRAPQNAAKNDDRRVGQRLSACMAVELNSDAKKGRYGIARNVSENGLMVITRSRFEVGDELDLGMHAGPAQGRARGRVRRIEETPRETELWRWSVGIELVGSMPDDILAYGRKAG